MLGEPVKKITEPVTKLSSVELESNNFVCSRATNMMSGKKGWHKSSHKFYKYVVEAKKRGLACGVSTSSSSPKTSSDCSVKNVKACSDALVCFRGSRSFNLASAAKYAIEAKRRGLPCSVNAVVIPL